MSIIAVTLLNTAGSLVNWDEEVALFGIANSSSWYAAAEYQCRGFSAQAALREANRALGAGFPTRLSAAAAKLEKLVGKKRVEEASTFVVPSVSLTPEYCRKTTGLVRKAHNALADLENRLGAE